MEQELLRSCGAAIGPLVNRICWALIACVAATGSSGAEGVPAGPDLARCRLVGVTDSAARLEERGGLAWRWRARPGEHLSCSGDAVEPLDLEAAAVLDGADSALVDVELLPAREVRLKQEVPAAIAIEWRRPAEGASELLARRPLEGVAIELPVARQERLLRVLREEASPVTLFVPADAPAGSELTLPAPAPGGELFARTPGRAVEPESYHLAGSAGEQTLRPNDGGFVSASGLRPGGYRLTPVYRGGLTAPAVDVAIRDGETTEVLPIPLPEVGGVDVALIDPELCVEPPPEPAPVLALMWIELLQEGRSQRFHRLGTWSLDAGCRVGIDGLAPGLHRATVTLPGSESPAPLAVAEAEVAVDEVTDLVVQRSAVIVEGRVRLPDGGPPVEAVVLFDRGSTTIQVETGADGEFTVDLPAPGAWNISVGGTRHTPAHHLERRFEPGVHQLDIEIPGGVLALRIERSDGAPIEDSVQLQFTEGSRWAGFLLPDELPEATILGLKPGRYEAVATSGSGWGTRRPVAFEIRESDPFATVDLLLEPLSLRLTVVDPSGAPVSGAMVWIDGMSGHREAASEPGVFILPGVAEGRRLIVDPPAGWSPQCVLSRGAGEQNVSLEPGLHSLLVVLRDGSRSLKGSLSGLPGSDCPLRLDQFAPVEVAAEGGVAFQLRELPAGRFTLHARGGEAIPVTVPGPPVVVEPADD